MLSKVYAIIGGVILLGYAWIEYTGVQFGASKLSDSPPALRSSSGRSGGGGWFGGGGGFGGGK